MDKIAVLIPCYNEEKTIKKVIDDWKRNYQRQRSMFIITTQQIIQHRLPKMLVS